VIAFSAMPANLPEGGGQTTLTWEVQNADSLAIDPDVGDVTGNAVDVSVTATTIFTLTATNVNGSVTATTAVVTGQNPSNVPGRSSSMISPSAGESFTAPATLRLIANGYDQNVFTNEPVDGKGTNASKVQFFVDDDVVFEMDGAEAEFSIFKGFVSGIAAGEHRVWARAIYVDPELVLDSEPRLITVNEPPAYGMTVDLDADVVLSGAQGYELIGTADSRIRLNGNGYRITAEEGTSGPFTLQFVDVFDVGNTADTSEPGVDVATSGAVTVEDSIFDSSNPVQVTLQGAATASVQRNVFRSNMRQPLGQQPRGPDSYASSIWRGDSTGAKVFAGNNVGAGWVQFENTQGWIVGGDTDADSNVLIGPRVGIYVESSSDIQIRRNYSHHDYHGAWSQGSNFELGGIATLTAEHNVIFGSSWPVRGVGGEFRYNAVLDAGHQWLWGDHSDSSIHHNLFVGGQCDVAGIMVLYESMNVNISNNTFDGLLNDDVVTYIGLDEGTLSVFSNAFLNAPDVPSVRVSDGTTLAADYNLFFNLGTQNYSDARAPEHDVAGGVQTDPMLTDPPTELIELDEAAIWKRDTTAADVLRLYGERYTPLAGSPLIDSGDPAGGVGNDVGAIGAGTANAADLFGDL
jgi:hypothetical protein